MTHLVDFDGFPFMELHTVSYYLSNYEDGHFSGKPVCRCFTTSTKSQLNLLIIHKLFTINWRRRKMRILASEPKPLLLLILFLNLKK